MEDLLQRISEFVNSLKPFKSSLVEIRSNYDKSITQFFELVQNLFVFSCVTALIYSYVMFKHIMNTQDKVAYYSDKLCGYMFPC